jgi:DNA-binding SARP family transcriptional activator/Flp pilus assembly protein TadD
MLRLFTLGGLGLEGPDGPVAGPAARRRSLALLAVIAASGPRGITRERLIGIFWPESPEEQGRHVLAQSLYALRKGLGAEELLLDGAPLRLNPAVVTSDVEQFNAALESGDRAAAVAAYGGPFLEGFYLSGAPAFERWVDDERARLAARFQQALDGEAAAAESLGDMPRAAALWRRRIATDLLATQPLVRLVRALEASGDRAAALRQIRTHVAIAEQEGAPVSPEIAALERSLREPSPVPAPPVATTPSGADTRLAAAASADQGADPGFSGNRAPRRRRFASALVIGAIVALLGAAAFVAITSVGSPPPVAVGLVESHLRTDSADLARALPDLVTTQLTQVQGLSVVSRARLLEVMGGDVQALGPGMLSRAARFAGAREIIEGAIYDEGSGMRLDLRRVELSDGKVNGAVSVTGDNSAMLVERGVAALAASFGLAAPNVPLASVTSVQPVARRFYEEGLRAFYSDDRTTAARMFAAALGEDSTFAMAAYYLAISGGGATADSLAARWQRATVLAPRATDRERLVILTGRAFALDDARGLAFAETLAVRYPNDLDGKQALGEQRYARGDFAGAVTAFMDVVRADSAGRSGRGVRCRACDAMGSAIWVSLAADSLAAAERLTRELIRWNPRRPGSYGLLGTVLLRREDFRGAAEAFRQQNALAPGTASPRWVEIVTARRQGDLLALDSIAEQMVRAPEDLTDMHNGLQLKSDVLREAGGLDSALRLARRFRRSADSSSGGGLTNPFNRLYEALALLELGRTDRRSARAAAALFDSMAAMPGYPELRMARHRVWMWTHQATALALAGDTSALPALERRIAEMARLSAYGRDWRMPYYVQGLLFEARRDWPRAADAYRRAIWSPAENHIAPRLARVLLVSGRPNEAVGVLQPWLRGPLDAANQYARRTEAHQLLGDAFAQLGRQDSAAVHHAWAVRARQAASTR